MFRMMRDKEICRYNLVSISGFKELFSGFAKLFPNLCLPLDWKFNFQQGAVGPGFSHFPNTTPYAAGYGNFAHPFGYANQSTTYSPVPQPGINPGRAGSPMGVPLIQSRTPSPPVNVPPLGSVTQTRTLESETQTPQPPSQKATQTGKPRRRSGSWRNSPELNQNAASKPAEKKQENDDNAKKPAENKPKGRLVYLFLKVTLFHFFFYS